MSNRIGKIALATLLGDVLVWYDYALYGQLITIISRLFLPEDIDQWLAMIVGFSIFAAGFFMRPIGSIVFGVIGDIKGRKIALTLSVVAISMSVLTMVILPGYAAIGMLAPFILIVVRLVQGFALGGESGNAVFLLECSPANKKVFYSSLQVLSAAIGILFAGVMVDLFRYWCGESYFNEWGWRITFVIGFVLSVVGLFVRLKLEESPEYTDSIKKSGICKSPLKELMKNYKARFFIAIGIDIVEEATLYILLVFFSAVVLGYDQIKNALTLFMVISTLGVALLSDRVNKITLMRFGCVLLLVFAYPALYCTEGCADWVFVLLQLIFVLVIALTIAPVNALMIELFPTRVCFTGFALARNVSAALFGGLAPVISALLVEYTGTNSSVAIYLMICAVIGLVSLSLIRKYIGDEVFKNDYERKQQSC